MSLFLSCQKYVFWAQPTLPLVTMSLIILFFLKSSLTQFMCKAATGKCDQLKDYDSLKCDIFYSFFISVMGTCYLSAFFRQKNQLNISSECTVEGSLGQVCYRKNVES